MEEEKLVDAVLSVIRGEMAARRMTQADLSEMTGIFRTTLQRYLAGTREMPLGVLITIAGALGMTAHEVFQLAESRLERLSHGSE